MRRLFAALAVVVTCAAPAGLTAQSHGGIIGGPGLSTFRAEESALQDRVVPDFTYSVGLQGRVGFQEFLALKPELLFSRRVSRLEGSALGFEFDNMYAISYLEIPILLRAAVPLADVLAPKVFVGPHASIFLDGRWEGDDRGPLLGGSGSRDIDSDDVRNLQFGVTAGLGLDINFDAAVLTSGVRYVRNFTPIFEGADRDEELRHESWLLMIGFMY